MNIAILGFGKQGKAALEYWTSPKNKLTICDENPNLTVPEGVTAKLGADYLKDLDQYDLLVRTPLLHPKDILDANPKTPDILNKVTTVTDEFIKVCPSKNIIGVTGTKGKGTTSTLIAKMLQKAGKRTHLGGNIGLPPLDMLKGAGALYGKTTEIGPDDWIVLELANFQLIDLKHSAHIAVCLMVEPEHMDWHEDVEEYIAAKQQLFINQKADDIAIYYSNNETSLDIAAASEGVLIPYFEHPGAVVADGWVTIDGQKICSVDELKLLGEHNWQNVCAAVTAVWQVTTDTSAIKSVLTDFSGLDHRLELIRTFEGVAYYDDSFGTTPATAIVAIDALAASKILILGGSDKGALFDTLAVRVAGSNVKAVITIGQMGPVIGKALLAAGFANVVEGGSTMSEIVNQARSLSAPGDAVLLSTACASFDMFENYQDRGEQFSRAVSSLS